MKNKKLKISLIVFFSIIVVFCGAFYIYTLDYNVANDNVYKMTEFKKSKTDGNMRIFMPPKDVKLNEDTGIIFYPGGKVESEAYSPLMIKLAKQGTMCVLIDMPMNLAIFDIDAADKVYSKYPKIDKWYLVGHSLGGAMASSYAEDNYKELSGLILLGAYPLNEAPAPTIVIYGSEDVGLNREKLKGVPNQFEIKGGNHSYFGNYDEHEKDTKRDGKTTITQDEQQDETVKLINSFINGKLDLD